MQRIAIVILFFFIKSAFGQTCPSLIEPLNGATNVPVDVTINWNHVEGSTGYIISIGTFSGGDDILSTQVGTELLTDNECLIQIIGIKQLLQTEKCLWDILA